MFDAVRAALLCISVKLKNLKANHNPAKPAAVRKRVVYIRKVKKSESKSQRIVEWRISSTVVYIRKVKKSESKSQHYNESENLLKAL